MPLVNNGPDGILTGTEVNSDLCIAHQCYLVYRMKVRLGAELWFLVVGDFEVFGPFTKLVCKLCANVTLFGLNK
jgi:hypothetical protein